MYNSLKNPHLLKSTQTHRNKQCLKIGEEKRAKEEVMCRGRSAERLFDCECRETAEWQNKCRIGELEMISPDLEKQDTRRANKWLDLTESQAVKDLKGRNKYKQCFFFFLKRVARKGENLLGFLCSPPPPPPPPPDGMLQWASLRAIGIILCLDKQRSIH